MTVLIDGIVFSLQRQGGISVYFHQLLDYLAQSYIAATLTLETPTRQAVTGSSGSVLYLRREGRRFERYRPCRLKVGTTVFHSSYYRRPFDRGTPTVVTVHDFIYERYSKGPRRWVHVAQKHAAIRAAQAVICISESTRQDLLHWVGETPGQQVLVIHNGVADTFRPLQLEPAARPYVLYVGERAGYKNFRLVLDAMTWLPELELHCVGGGALRPDELAHVTPDLRARVQHLGFVSENVLNEHYNRAVCLAYPSRYEGFGIPVVEAMRAGCPVVCIACKAVLEVGGNALTVAAEASGHAIAEAISRTALSGNRHAIVQAGLAVARAYSWQSTHQQTVRVYCGLGAHTTVSQ
ncbi:MAG: glycosyltransferase family 1 protein [Burkholderiaceae bacterium]